MGAKKDYSVVVDGHEVFCGPIRTASIVYKSFESYFIFMNESKKHSVVLSFKL